MMLIAAGTDPLAVSHVAFGTGMYRYIVACLRDVAYVI